MSEFRYDNEGLQAVLSGQDGAVWLRVLRLTNQVKNSAKRKAPVDRGKLRASITSEMVSENGKPIGVVGTNLEYAIYVHEGTGLWSKTNPGYIRPKTKPFLAWPKINKNYRDKVGGVSRGRRRYKYGKTYAYVFSKKSSGSRGRPFLTDALKEVTGQS